MTLTAYRTAAPQSEPYVPRTRWDRFLCLLGLHEGPIWVHYHCEGCDACGRVWIQ